MKRELSTKLGKDFRNWENDGEKDYETKANEASQSGEFERERGMKMYECFLSPRISLRDLFALLETSISAQCR